VEAEHVAADQLAQPRRRERWLRTSVSAIRLGTPAARHTAAYTMDLCTQNPRPRLMIELALRPERLSAAP
jgi:hypothetical protein